jgi:hydrogenase expression/formation protein HypC
MCLGIPGEVTAMVEGNDQLALVDVLGVERQVNIGMLDAGEVRPGSRLLIHMGFAMETITEQQAADALAGLQMMGQAPDPG